MNPILSFLMKQVVSLLMNNKEVIKQMLWELLMNIIRAQRAKAEKE